MRKFLPLLLCLALSTLSMARAAKAMHAFAPETDAKKWVDYEKTEEDEVASGNDDSEEVPSDDQGEDVNDERDGDAAGDEQTGDDDTRRDDEGDDGADEGG